MRLVDVYQTTDAPRHLYELLGEREPHHNISHKAMPTWQEHLQFIDSRPYLAWYLAEVADVGCVGSCYLSRGREIGIFVYKRHRGKGYGVGIGRMLWSQHPGRLLCNLNPDNMASRRMVERIGFRPLQVTYSLDAVPVAEEEPEEYDIASIGFAD